jgi:hypothetical protein
MFGNTHIIRKFHHHQVAAIPDEKISYAGTMLCELGIQHLFLNILFILLFCTLSIHRSFMNFVGKDVFHAKISLRILHYLVKWRQRLENAFLK